jgi:hypothetical protein
MTDLNDLAGALRMKNWYAVAAIVLMVIVQLVRKYPKTSPFWQKVPDGLRFLPGMLVSFGVGFVAGWQEHLPVLDALMQGVGGIIGISIPAMGLAATIKESPIPWDGGSGGVAPLGKSRAPALPIATLCLSLLCLPLTTSCFHGATSADTAALVVRSEHAAFNAAVAGLELLDQAEADRIEKIRTRGTPPTDAELAAADARVARLVRVKAALAVARTELEQKNGKGAEASILGAVPLLVVALDEAKADGVPIPQAVKDAIVSASTLIGGAP